MVGGVVSGITITNPGINYTSVPTFTLNGGGGTGASVGTGTATVVANAPGSLTFQGIGTTILTSGLSTYSGGTTIAAGTLALGASSTGSPTITSGPVGTGAITLNLGGTLQINDGPFTVLNPIKVTGGSSGIATIQNITTATTTDTLSGQVSVFNPVTVVSQATSSTGLLVLSGPVTGQALTFSTTAVTLSGANAGNAATAAAGESYTQSQITGLISDGTNGGKLLIAKTSAGGWQLTNNSNSYSGGTQINGGDIEITQPGALGGASGGPVSVAAGAQLAFDFAGGAVSNSITLNGLTTNLNGNTGALVGDNFTGAGNNTLNGTLTLAVTGVFSNVSTSGSGSPGNSLTLAGQVTGGGGLQIDLYHTGNGGPHIFLTNATNNYTGGTLVNAGTLTLVRNSALGGATGGLLTIKTGATVDMQSFNQTVGGLSDGAGNTGGGTGGSLTSSTGTPTLTITDASQSFGGVISGGINIIVNAGSGYQILQRHEHLHWHHHHQWRAGNLERRRPGRDDCRTKVNDGGTLVLKGNTDGLSFNAEPLTLGSGGGGTATLSLNTDATLCNATWTGAIMLTAGSTNVISRGGGVGNAGALTVSGAIGGNGGLTVGGPANFTLLLTNANNYTVPPRSMPARSSSCKAAPSPARPSAWPAAPRSLPEADHRQFDRQHRRECDVDAGRRVEF